MKNQRFVVNRNPVKDDDRACYCQRLSFIALSGHAGWYRVCVVAQPVQLSLLLYMRGSQEIVPEKL